jgi:hypothetical protein
VEVVVMQVSALPILYIVSDVTTRSMLYAQRVIHAGHSNTHATWSDGTSYDCLDSLGSWITVNWG